MQLTQKFLKRVDIFSPVSEGSGYVGTKTAFSPLGFVYAEVYPESEKYSRKRSGQVTEKGATLILRNDAGVKCGDLAAVFGKAPDSRIAEVKCFPGHLSVRTELI